MMPAMLWVVCGAGRGVGKTHLAQELCAVLPNSVYAKQGCGRRRPDGPPNFFQSNEELAAFLERGRPAYEHIVVESNELARSGRGDLVIYVDGLPHETDIRDDAERLRARAQLQISAHASIRDWKKCLRHQLADSVLREAVCDCLMKQKRHLFKGPPEVRVKMWFVEGGMHIFGAGLARLLEHVDRYGTLRDATQAAHMSYRYAWGLIRNAEKHHGQPLVIPQPGGVGGGQSMLSEHGRQLLRTYQDFSRKIKALADECFAGAEVDGSPSADAARDKPPPDIVAGSGLLAGAGPAAVSRVEPVRISTAGVPPVRESCEVVVETPLTIMIADVGSFTIMCTPGDAKALAVGFAFSEGMITGVEDLVELKCTSAPPAVALRLEDPSSVVSQRNLLVTSSRGLCGRRNIDEFLADVVPCENTLRVSGDTLLAIIQKMRAAQELFQRTGGTHAAGIFSPEGELLAFGEDIGRHNALDKAIGHCLLREQVPRGCGAVLSGRVSFELVAKAARAGIELIAAVSAPSSLAIEAAERCNLTLCGFVRDTRATIYTHPYRVIDLAK
ncbi:MAG: formate dehydrogenase accessory sulfurtransferase FdhD [Phycisphaerae bacterium]|nr:formate dehydrogenase accessory sulfurtransferase FdhD [Phycisphaerae bacterium]